MPRTQMTQAWSPTDYAKNAAFVPALGTPLLDRLAIAPGERILDLGCGDGTLTRQIVDRGAVVVGVDASPAMVAAAQAAGIDARVADATALPFDAEFDAVFSNAVLHWVKDAHGAARSIARALKPGGRFVAEFGGHGNVAGISTAIRAVLDGRGVPYTWPWYYPAPAEYSAILEAAGFEVTSAALIPRPTLLPTGLAGWLDTFAVGVFSGAPAEERQQIRDAIVALATPALRDAAGNWTADYVRLQIVGVRSAPPLAPQRLK